MYCISEIDSKDFNMILNDKIIDCFLDESDIQEAKTIAANEFDALHAQLKDPHNICQMCKKVIQPKPRAKQRTSNTTK